MSTEKTSLISLLDSVLKPLGFQRKSSTWVRTFDEVKQVVELQKSQYGQQFYLNIAFSISHLEGWGEQFPKEFRCPIRARLGAWHPEIADKLKLVLDFERDEDLRLEEIRRLLEATLIPQLDRAKSLRTLKSELDHVEPRVMVTLAARKLFASVP